MIWLPYAILYSFFFITGSCLGSFVNVVIYRLPRHLGIARGRSFCPACGHTLAPADLVPVFSWIFLKRRCRYCGAPISFRYPLGEILGGLCAVLCPLVLGFTWGALLAFCVLLPLYALAMIDLDTHEIPDSLIIALAVPALAALLVFPEVLWWERLIGLAAVSLPMLLMNLLIRDSFGGGDIKLMLVCGFLLGWQQALLAGFLALVAGGICGAVLWISGKKGRKDHFAFGPFLAGGVAVALLWGPTLLHTYLTLFGLQ